jgi:hypothetical protein
MVVHICNPRYLGGIDERIMVGGQPQAKKHEILSER